MIEHLPANQCAAKDQKRFVDIAAAFVSNSQSAILVKPTERSLHHPTEDTQATAMFSVPLSNQRLCPVAGQHHPMRLRIIRPVSTQALRPLQRPARFAGNRRNRIHQWQKLRHVMPVRPSQDTGKRDAVGVGDEVVFAAQLPSIRRIWACFRPPKTARTEALSTTARDKSICSACRNRFSRMRWIRSQIPASFTKRVGKDQDRDQYFDRTQTPRIR